MFVFDWDEAARIIKEKKPETASAGLLEDLSWTVDDIVVNGRPFYQGWTWLASVWAQPVLIIGNEIIPCWVWNPNSHWDAETKWPQSALDILESP